MSDSGLRARVGRQTALYGLGLVLGKALSFLSLPIYTRLLTPADYGVIQLIEMTFDMLTILAGSRLGVGIFRFYHKSTNDTDRRAVLTTALMLVFCTFSVIAVGAWFFAESLSNLIFGSDSYAPVIRVAALSFPWDGVIAIPLGFLRLRDRAGAFVLVGLAKSLLQLAGVYVLLAHYDMGIRGVFISTLIANIIVGSILVTLMLREIGLRFSTRAAGDLVRFGMPLVITQIATFFTTFGDRYFLQSSAGETEVGIYALAYTFGFLLFTLGYTPFGSVWDPVRFEVAQREDRDALFSRAFIHMNLLLVTVGVGLAVFSADLLRVMSDPAYWAAAPLIPVILVAYLLQGWSAFHDVGILVREQTRYVTIANWAAAFAAGAGYVFLIPRYAGWGAAWATVAAFSLRAVLIYRFSQRLWPLRYEWAPVKRLLVIAGVTVAIHSALPLMGLLASILVRSALIAGYALAVWKTDIIPIEERDLLREWLRHPIGRRPDDRRRPQTSSQQPMKPSLSPRSEPVTVVMYHYVREVPDRHGFAMKGMLPEEFEGQLDYIGRHYSVCSLSDVVSAARGQDPLPPRPCVLTFDDGLMEHAREVWPRLRARGWSGAFFASAAATLDRSLLDVHRIHMLLASCIEPAHLCHELMACIDARAGAGVPGSAELWARYGVAGRFDPPEANFIKRVLQKGLPREVRRDILSGLFRRFVSDDESTLAEEFYVRLEDLQDMAADGMEIGGHGIQHEWLDDVSDRERAREIHGTLDLLRRVHGGQVPDRWFFAYPYGAYDRQTVELLEGAGCDAAVTVRVALATAGTPLLELPRIDANDLPREACSPPADWSDAPSALSTWEPAPADP